MKHIFIIASTIIISSVLWAQQKIEFWDTQRKGANCFNTVPTEQWFEDALSYIFLSRNCKIHP